MEGIGAFFLVLAIGLTGNMLAIGLLLGALIYSGAHVSGAHFNPAVSFAFFLRRNMSFTNFVGYVVSQILGVFAATGILIILAGTIFFIEPPASTDIIQQAIVEILLAFILVSVYMNFQLLESLKGNKIYGIVIGLTFTATLILGQDISGSFLNPAVSIGASLTDFITINGSSYTHIPLFTLAPLVGSALAVLVFKYFND